MESDRRQSKRWDRQLLLGGDRMMLVDNHPLSVALAQADRQAKIEFDILSAGLRARTSHCGADKRHVAAGRDIKFLDIEDRGVVRP